MWQRRYGGDPGIVGRRIDVNGRPTMVVGVMPVGFRLLMPPDAAVPDDLEAWQPLNRRFPEGPRGQRYLRVIGRMRPGVRRGRRRRPTSPASAARSRRRTPSTAPPGRQFETVPLHVDATRDVRRPLLALSVGVAILLLIACVNVGSLLVARAAGAGPRDGGEGGARRQRRAAGAPARRRVAGARRARRRPRACCSAAGGWPRLLAATPDALSRLRLARWTRRWPRSARRPCCSGRVLLAAAPVSRGAARRRRPGRCSTTAGAPAADASRLRAALTVAQIALSVVLVVGALLLVRTVQRVQQVDPGFHGRRRAVVPRRAARARAIRTRTRSTRSRAGCRTALAAMPGATAAVGREPRAVRPRAQLGRAVHRHRGRRCLDGAASRLPRGRAGPDGAARRAARRGPHLHRERRSARRRRSMIVDERLARRTWPGESAIGRRLGVDPTVAGTPSTWTTVVGVVRHVRHRSPIEEVRDQVYFPERQMPRNPVGLPDQDAPATRRRSSGPCTTPCARSMRRCRFTTCVRSTPTSTEARALRRFTAVLAVLFAAGGAGAGGGRRLRRGRVFGHRAAPRVRRAAGARRARLGRCWRWWCGEGAALAGAGLAIGLVGAAAGAWWLRSQLYGVAPWDPVSLAATLPILALASLLACHRAGAARGQDRSRGSAARRLTSGRGRAAVGASCGSSWGSGLQRHAREASGLLDED